MEKFLKAKKYIEMKQKYEKEYFKLGGEYAWYDGDKIVIKSASKVSEQFKNKKIVVELERETPDGEIQITKKEKTFYQIWSEDPNMKEYNEVIFDCDTLKTKPYQFNLFDGFSIKNHKIVDKTVAEEGLKRVNEHISILCNHKADGIKTTKYFYAQALQQPHILPNFCMVFISKEGVGKDMFSEFVENIFGEKYCFNTDKLDNLVGKFNSMFGAKIQGVINETNPVDSSQRRDNIKYVITAKKVQIEGKHKDPIKAPNYCRLTFYANRLTAFPIEEGSRRPYIQYCSSEMLPKYCGAKKSKEYFDTLGKYMNNRDVQKAFYDELMKFDIKNFNFKDIEKSDLQKTLEDASKPILSEFLYHYIYKVDAETTKELKIKTVDLLVKYTEYTKKRNMKFDMNQRTFNTEIEQDYKIKKYASCGTAKFLINVADLKQLLTDEYKYTFGDKEEENEQDPDDKELDNGIDKTDKAVKMTLDEEIEHYEKILTALKLKKSLLVNNEDESDEKPKKIDKAKAVFFGPIKDVVITGSGLKQAEVKSDDVKKENIPSIDFANF